MGLGVFFWKVIMEAMVVIKILMHIHLVCFLKLEIGPSVWGLVGYEQLVGKKSAGMGCFSWSG